MNNLQGLSLDQVRRAAPSVFAEGPKDSVSSRYTFIPTTRVLAALQSQGWVPVRANQSSARSPEGLNFSKHVIRFRKEGFLTKETMSVGDSIPELVLTNSHNATSAFQLFLGIFRLVCSNGAVVADATVGRVSIRHTGYQDEKVVQASSLIIENAPKAIERIASFRSTNLHQEEAFAFANAALALKYEPGTAPIQARDLLTQRRAADVGTDLWTTFNRVQENVIRGGLAGRASTGRRTRTRQVQSVGEDLRLNRALWTLAESLQSIKAKG